MSKRATPTLIGAFVLGAIVLTTLALMVLGGGELFRERIRYVTYFQGSVQGLRVGANVSFRGVRVGEVVDVHVRIDEETLNAQLPVVIELTTGTLRNMTGVPYTTGGDQELIHQLIDRGLRAQLQIESFVTGQLLVDLDFYPNAPAIYHGTDDDLVEVPTVPSEIQAALERAQSFLARVQSMPVEDIVLNAHQITEGVDRLVNSPRLEEILASLAEILKDPDTAELGTSFRTALDDFGSVARELERLVARLDADVSPLAAQATDTLQAMQRLAIEAEGVMAGVERDLQGGSTVRYEFLSLLRELEETAHSFRIMAEYLERHPEALLRGKPQDGGTPDP